MSSSKCLNGSKEPEKAVVLAGQQVVTTCRLAERTQNERQCELLTLAQRSSEPKEKQETGSHYQGKQENS